MRVRICGLDKEKTERQGEFMRDVKVKICGITNLEDALLAEELGADALGFIFYKKSKRYIQPEKAAEIIARLSPFTLKVGVFVNSPVDEINKIAAEAKLNLIQLHGDEKPEIIKEINLPVVKAFRVNEYFDFKSVENFECAGYLFDTLSGNKYGGTGIRFNWDSIPHHLRSKIILAGGIGTGNLNEAIKINPAAIDLSSAIELFPGKKDEIKMREFFNEFYKFRSQ